MVLPNTTALALAGHPETAGSASALLGLGQFVFGAAAAPFVGLGGRGTALPMAVVIASLGVAANVVLFLLTRVPRRARVFA
jgi:DHA1 family bicyclomycin/chloramphenicol resistance-like MFS transporter